MTFGTKRLWDKPPPFGTELNRNHPLAPDVLYLRQTSDMVKWSELEKRHPSDPSNNFDNRGFRSNDQTGSNTFFTSSKSLPVRGSLTAFWQANATVTTGFDCMFEINNVAGDHLFIRRNPDNAGIQEMSFYCIGNFDNVIVTDDTLFRDVPHWFTFTWTQVGAGSQLNVYIDGVFKGQDASTASFTANSPFDVISIGASDTGNNLFNAPINDVMMHSRALSEQEIISLHNNPYQIFKPRKSFAFADVPEDTRFVPVRTKKYLDEQPANFTNAVQDNVVSAFVPAWSGMESTDDASTLRSVISAGYPMRLIGLTEGAPSGTHSYVQNGRTYGGKPVRTGRIRQFSNTVGHRFFRGDDDLGPPLGEKFTCFAIFYPEGDGTMSGISDPRIWSKDLGGAEADHDFMVGIVRNATYDTARARVRIGTTTHTVTIPEAGGTNRIRENNWNFVAVVVDGANITLHFWGLNNGVYASASASGTGVYNPRTTTDIGMWGNGGTTDNKYEGETLIVAFLKGALNKSELELYKANPWRVFKPELSFVPHNEKLPDLTRFEVKW